VYRGFYLYIRLQLKSPFKMIRKSYYISMLSSLCLGIFLFTTCLSLYAAEQKVTTDPENSDVRVLIDVSGSMKKNDPQNLRSPALRLLVGLLPNGTRAGVWNFGTQVNELVKMGLTDDKWKNAAINASKKIHSKDLFTNIGQAMSSATNDWQGKAVQTHKRNLILLTDGMVDISKDDKKNVIERNNILAELLPELKKSDVQIHTIALSENADKDFLEKLSTDTDGSFTQTEDAEQLERIFLHLFEKATQPDTIPLIDNNFKVDDSVYELTLLVFKDKNAPERQTEVVEAGGKTYKKSKHPRYVKWRAEKNYDLITITKPVTGDWSINANIDPDNRVMVVTNLKIQTNRLPNNVFLGEQVSMNLFLSEEKEMIKDDDFLQLVSISVVQEENRSFIEKPPKKWYLHDNGLRGDLVEHDGIFNLILGETLDVGKNEFIIRASSDTFERELNKSFLVRDIPLLLSHLAIQEGESKTIKKLMVTPNLEYLSSKNVQISALLSEESGRSKEVELENINPRQMEWSLDVSDLDHTKDFYVIFALSGQTRKGRPIKYRSKKISINLNQIEAATQQTDSLDDINVKVLVDEEPDEEPIEPIKLEPEEPMLEPQEGEVDWTMGIIIAVGVNIVLGLLAWLFYRRWKQRQDNDLIDLTGELE